MKKFFGVLLVIILGTALTFGMAYAIDQERMDKGKPVVFSTWGKDYEPKAENKSKEKNVEPKQEQVAEPDAEQTKKSDATIKTEDAKTEIPAEKEVTLYFADSDLAYLCSEKRTIETKDGIEKAVVEAVIEGPKSENTMAVLTPDVKVISASVSNSTCVVNLSKEFILNNTGGSFMETFAIYSIVNSLCELPGIDNVKINVEGKENENFGGYYDMSMPIEPDMTIVSK